MSSDLQQRLFDHWQRLSNTLGLDEAKSKEAYHYLVGHYSGADRHYHNIRHIVSMLDGFEPLKEKFQNPEAAKLAIFFHDVIYDPARTDNEEQSAIKMQELLKASVDSSILDMATFTIHATKKHVATASKDTNLVVDLDMAIIGQPWAVYEGYAAGTMKEYLQVYSEAQYRQGRVAIFLEPTMNKSPIFLTEEFSHLNAPAISNMRREKEIMETGKAFFGQVIGK